MRAGGRGSRGCVGFRGVCLAAGAGGLRVDDDWNELADGSRGRRRRRTELLMALAGSPQGCSSKFTTLGGDAASSLRRVPARSRPPKPGSSPDRPGV